MDLHGLWPPVRSQTSWRARLMMPWLALRAKPKCSVNTGYRTSQCRLVVKLWGSRSYMLYYIEVVLRVLCVTMSLAALCCLFLCVFFGGGTQSHHQIYQYLAVVSGAIRFFPRAVSETPAQWPISFASTFIWQCEEETSTRWQQAINFEAIANPCRRFNFWNPKRPSIVETRTYVSKFPSE